MFEMSGGSKSGKCKAESVKLTVNFTLSGRLRGDETPVNQMVEKCGTGGALQSGKNQSVKHNG